MNVTLDQLRALVTVGRLGSFTRAARVLHLSQPAVSTQVRHLEEALGARLLDRTTRSVALSAAGRALVPPLERVLHDLELVALGARAHAAEPQGVVTVAALPSVSSGLLPLAIARFRAQFPAAAVRLRDAVADRVLALVKAGEAELGIGTAMRADPEIEVTPLLTDELRAVFRRGHPLERRARVSLDELRAHPLVLTDPQSSLRKIVDRAFEARGELPSPAYEVTYMSTAAALAAAGLGVALLPSSALEGARRARLVARPIRDRGLTRHVGLIRRAGRSLSPPAERFAAILAAAARSWRS